MQLQDDRNLQATLKEDEMSNLSSLEAQGLLPERSYILPEP